jgi:cytochrome P450/ferredoxin-NADP reductase
VDEITVEQLEADPYPAYAALRSDRPVAWIPWASAYLVTRWEDVHAVARDPDTFSATVGDSPLTATLGPNLLHSDGSYHAELRAPLTRTLRPAQVARRMRGVITDAVADLVAGLNRTRQVDLVAELAQPLAIRVLTRATGLPPVDPATLMRWLDGIAAGASNYERDPAKSRLAADMCREIDEMLVMTLREGIPEGSIIDALTRTMVDDRPLGFAELSATVKLLIIGGAQEPRDLFGFAIGAFLQRPDIRARVRADPAAIPVLIEESLRWGSPVGTVTRKTTRPVTLGGVELPAGAVLAAVVSSANRDEGHWTNPDDFDIDRSDHEHLAFSAGPHTCVGATLARTEVRLALEALIERFPGLELDGPVIARGWEFRGPVAVPVRLGSPRVHVARPAAPPAVRRQLRVCGTEPLTPDVRLITLEPADGEPLPAVEPGAHVDVFLPDHAPLTGGGPAVRQYSLTGDLRAARNRWQIAVRRQATGRGGSRWLHDEVSRGDVLQTGYPRNNFRLVGAPAYLFLAGGIGITPIVPMAIQAERAGIPWRLHYIGRSIEGLPFAGRLPGAAATLWTTKPDGRPDLGRLLEGAPEGTAVYCCGPAAMLDEAEARHASGTGPWSRVSLHVERFTQRTAAAADDEADAGFRVYLQRSDLTVTVQPGCSVLSAMAEAGVLIPSTCREGICGSCETTVLQGDIDHRDSVLSPEERARNDTMMVCVSRARSPRLVLDA